MVSVIIPVYKEPYLNRTIQSLLDNAEGHIEVLVVFDGEEPDNPLPDDPRVRKVYSGGRQGMRGAINLGVKLSNGEWIMKTDAHCAFAPGWDTTLTAQTQKDWLMIPRRYSLDEENWGRDLDRPMVDYQYLSYPGDETRSDPKYGYSCQPKNTVRRVDGAIGDTMIFQGSCWFADREYFMKNIYPLDTEHYGPFGKEQVEIGLRYWLGGGAIKVNTNTWYAHLSKRKEHYDNGFSRRYKTAEEVREKNEWVTKHWMNDEEPNMVHPFSWLIEKFWDTLEGWPDDWNEKV